VSHGAKDPPRSVAKAMEEARRLISQATNKTQQRVKVPEELEAERKAREEEEREEEELERQCEQWCGKICRIGIVVPLLFSYILHPVGEFLIRPSMVVDTSIDLGDLHAVVTGGCSGMGLHTAAMLAESGASVVLGCRSNRSEGAMRALRTVRDASARWGKRTFGQARAPRVLSLRLDSFASVRAFARQYAAEVGRLQLLVNGAGTREACSLTEDGIEVAFQVNYLGHFLLTRQLLPLLRESASSRVVHVTCREGYVRRAHGWNHWFRDGWLKGWLGWPTPITEGLRVGSNYIETKLGLESEDDGETGHELVADGVDDAADDERQEETRRAPRSTRQPAGIDWSAGCKSERAYVNAKLAVLMFSRELERVLRRSPDSDGTVSHAINPNAVASEYGSRAPTPSSQQQRWTTQSMASYLPPVWITRRIFDFIYSHISTAMMRSVEHGARGVFHVATAPALAAAGGGLFDDAESAFTDCGRPARQCGRVPRSWEPPIVHDRQAAARLWELSEDLVGEKG